MIQDSLEVSAEEISSISLQGMSNPDYVEFMSKFQTTLSKYPTVVTGLVSIAGEFDGLITKLKASLVAERGSSYTMTLAESDKFRDGLHRGLCHIVEAHRWHKDKAMVVAANQLRRVIKQYGTTKLRNGGYDAETALIRSLVADLNSDNNASYSSLISLTNWITDLAEANTAFEALMEGRLDASAAGLSYTTRDARLVLTPVYRKVVKLIEVGAIVGTDPMFADFITKINSEIVYKK